MLQTVPEEPTGDERRVSDRRSSTEITPAAQGFVDTIRKEGDEFIEVLKQRDQEVIEDMNELQDRNESLQRHVEALSTEIRDMRQVLQVTNKKFSSLKSHVEDLQNTAAAVTRQLSIELGSKG